MAEPGRDLPRLVARGCGGAAAAGSLLAAGIHQGFGGPEVAETLRAAADAVPAGYLVQIEAAWVGATLVFVLLGVGLGMAAWRRTGWLHSLGLAAAIWFAGIAVAFLWAGPRWGEPGVAPQAVLLFILAALCAVAWRATAPRRP